MPYPFLESRSFVVGVLRAFPNKPELRMVDVDTRQLDCIYVCPCKARFAMAIQIL